MLKINKTLSKVKLYHIGIITLICGIMPGLMGLSYYGSVEKVSAATLSIDDISTMQEMRPGICYNMKIGDTATLTDTRDNSTYTIVKLSDGKCWMTENLKLDLTEAGIATAAESDNLSADFPEIALTSVDKFTNDNTTAQIAKNPTIINNSAPGDGKGYQSEYGYYYSWCAATGGTCEGVSTDGNDASGSICPKGWKLPEGGTGTTNDFAIMGGITSSVSKDTNYWNSAKNPSFSGNTLTVNGSTWIAAGAVSTNGLYTPGSYGLYWSSSASSSAFAYAFSFHSGGFSPAYTDYKYLGRTVRCVTDSYEEVLPGIDQKDVDVIAVVVPPVISIDATSGMNKEVDPNLVTKGEISATISANTTYSVQLSAEKTSLTSSQNPEDTEITSANSIPASSNVQAKTNAWGILNENGNTYSAITSTPTTYHNTETTNADSSRTHTFTLGVSVSPTLPAGEYSTTVTITAVNN